MKVITLLLYMSVGVQASVFDAVLHWTGALIRRDDAPECKQYTVKENDTCFSIMRTTNATYAQLISWNDAIDGQCSNLAKLEGDKICITNPDGDYTLPSNSHGVTTTASTPAPVPTNIPDDSNKRCGEWYRVEKGDDCAVLLNESGITRKDFLFLNPQVNENCTNLWLDYAYCIEPVGTIKTYDGYDGYTTRPPLNQTPTTELPDRPGPIDLIGNNTAPAVPKASGTRKDCYRYIWFKSVEDNEAADCWRVADFYDASSQDFILWNPSLEENDDGAAPASVAATPTETTTSSADYAYDCTLSPSLSYCAQLSKPTQTPEKPMVPPSPRGADEIANCTRWLAPSDGMTCEVILTVQHISSADFFKMNPSVGEDCSKMSLGTYYCVSTYPGGIPSGIDSGDDTTTSESSTATKTTTQPSTTTTTEPGETPSPVQDGMTDKCNEFYKVKKGDGCDGIAKDHDIARDDFHKWNPAVKKDCTLLIADYYVCVGVKK